MSKGEFAIIGTGEVPCGNYPDRTEFEIAYTLSRMAIKDAGIDKSQIGAVLGAAHIMGSEYNTEVVFGRLPEAIGLRNCQVTGQTVFADDISLPRMLHCKLLRSSVPHALIECVDISQLRL